MILVIIARARACMCVCVCVCVIVLIDKYIIRYGLLSVVLACFSLNGCASLCSIEFLYFYQMLTNGSIDALVATRCAMNRYWNGNRTRWIKVFRNRRRR